MSDEALARARLALEGLSVGDAFGSVFEFDAAMLHLIEERKLPPVPWRWTDDTNMALSMVENLRRFGQIEQDALVTSFIEHFDPMRGDGIGLRTMVSRMREGEDWRLVSRDMFWQQGSFGNGAAMRVAPIGA
jgi:ADP-ribosylglycohydrolase